ncbi:MAG: hypothetical protein ACOY5F_00070 [Pseudomonadota bacterium]|jgi:hypothetical protein
MGTPVEFEGQNFVLRPPTNAENILPLPVFRNGKCCVSCWELSDSEIDEIVRSRRVYVTVFLGDTQPPVYVGSEADVRGFIADYGVWKRDRQEG